ncbi:hypothetical protein LVO79_21080 (plasmid) [Roseivivax marinus]|uniref:hypothetical protein n=1 Tax=Roseivivax marinus TaxID=1379903 RepID=UPI001F04FC95|nr:hypothetical protein [Roseivivax marinus]UMA67294.1 hypothetical protein LVO79_21080 [Roseivivax marinus]
MIELGKQYRMVTLEMGENGYHEMVETVTFTEIDGNLAKTDRHTIINLTSPVLHSLTDVAAANADMEAAHAAYMNRED